MTQDEKTQLQEIHATIQALRKQYEKLPLHLRQELEFDLITMVLRLNNLLRYEVTK